MNTTIQSFTKLGDTFDTSHLPRGTVYNQLVIRVGQNGNDANYVVRDADSLGRLWAINLIPWTLPGPLTTPANGNRNKCVLVAGTSRAIITVGSDGASEEITVDYPAQGTTVIVSGQQITVALTGQTPPGIDPTFFPPIIGAYISPATNGGALGDGAATLTTAPNSLPPEGSDVEGVPARARAFRVFTGLDPLPAAGLLFTQVDGHLDPLAIQDRVNYTDPFFAPASRSQWYPLHPDCQLLFVNNRDATSNAGFALQWLIETHG